LQDANKNYLTSLEAMQFLGISRSGLFNLLQRKQISQFKIKGLDKRVYYSRTQLEKLFAPVTN
jgi:predicted DNA-binding transcriptional regulator AlpA